MKSRLPNIEEMDELIAYLPILCIEGFEPVIKGNGGERDKNGIISMP